MSIDNIEARILAAKNKTTYPVVREEGTAPLPSNNIVGKGQVSANVAPPTSAQAEAARAAERSGVVDEIHMSDNKVNPDDVVAIGDHCVIYPQPLRGWEAQLTKGGLEPYVVLVDDLQQIGGEAIAAVYRALCEQQATKKAKR